MKEVKVRNSPQKKSVLNSARKNSANRAERVEPESRSAQQPVRKAPKSSRPVTSNKKPPAKRPEWNNDIGQSEQEEAKLPLVQSYEKVQSPPMQKIISDKNLPEIGK